MVKIVAPHVGVGIDRRTGKVIHGFAHVLQSLQVIFTTGFGERVIRRWFGSAVPKLLGQNITPPTVLRFWTAIIVAIDLWEPRYKVVKITSGNSPEALRLGIVNFKIEGIFYPRGHLGDYSVQSPQTVDFNDVASS